MTEQDLIARRVRDVISEVADDMPEHLITAWLQLRANLGLETIDVYDLIRNLESEFEIALDEAGEDSIFAPKATAGDVLDVVMRHLKKEKA